ncbi:hypothetical protein HNQ59_000764 [Chitinivorax tropicus]|uniref:Lipoprotein n=1 Tax=Chitinivorax tropicus TaxID=714531 RepID=A0A840MGH0_9PROT|nr:hypothetical protein [Chitinivorax tropicus]MBB5017500.1 hypothetical protein [Chitinivorax tropicus]
MKGMRGHTLTASLLLALTLLGCTDSKQTEPTSKEKQSMNTSITAASPISLSLFEPVASWQAKFPNMQVDKQPAGVNFYKVRFPKNGGKNQAKILFEFGRNSIEIPAVLSITGPYNLDFPNENISEIWINSGLTENKEEMHDQARQAFFKLLDDIVKAGWKPYLSESYPRLMAKEILRRVAEEKDIDAKFNLRPEYMPTLDEWMALGDSLHWNFHANHVEMQITLSHDITKRDPQKPGAYFMSINLRPMTHAMQDGMAPEERRDWRAVWLKSLPVSHAERAAEEAKAKAAGHQIDTDYQDPPMPPEH